MACVVVRRREMEGKEGQGEQWESPASRGALPGCPQEERWILGPLLQDRLLGVGACRPHHRRRVVRGI